jgi:hypothetical protein
MFVITDDTYFLRPVEIGVALRTAIRTVLVSVAMQSLRPWILVRFTAYTISFAIPTTSQIRRSRGPGKMRGYHNYSHLLIHNGKKGDYFFQ